MKLDLTKLPVLEMIVGFLLVVLAVTFVGAFAATQGPAAEEPAASSATPDGATPSTPPGGNVAVALEDNKFGPAELTVAAGDTVTFAITNDGKAIHDMRIAGPDGEYDSDDDAVSDPDAIRSGAAGTLQWTAPAVGGEIKFQCDFHPNEMKGTITVQ